MNTVNLTPYADLTPDCVLDAVESVGLMPDGRLLALNSYENRVYQVGLDDEAPIIAKFYRPGRWNDAAIEEEHAFMLTLAALEIPAVAPLRFAGRTLHHFRGHRLALMPRRGGRHPELGDLDVLEWIGRFIGRIHAVGAVAPFIIARRLILQSLALRHAIFCLHKIGFQPICSTPIGASPITLYNACAIAMREREQCA